MQRQSKSVVAMVALWFIIIFFVVPFTLALLSGLIIPVLRLCFGAGVQ